MTFLPPPASRATHLGRADGVAALSSTVARGRSGTIAWVASVTAARGTAWDTSPSTNERSVAVTGWVASTCTPRAPSLTAAPRIALSGTRVTEPGGTRTSSRPSGRKAESLVTTRTDGAHLVVAVVGERRARGCRRPAAARAASGRCRAAGGASQSTPASPRPSSSKESTA